MANNQRGCFFFIGTRRSSSSSLLSHTLADYALEIVLQLVLTVNFFKVTAVDLTNAVSVILDADESELSMGPFCVTQSNPTHYRWENLDPTQYN